MPRSVILTWPRLLLATLLPFGAALGCEPNPAFDPPGQSETEGTEPTSSGTGELDAGTELETGDDPVGPAVLVDQLAGGWTTPEQIRWEWQVEGAHDRFFAFELVTGPTEADVLAQSPMTRTWTSADNPELGYLLVGGVDWVQPLSATTTDGHTPNTAYFAQLRAIDTQGQVALSNVAMARTQLLPTESVTIYADEAPPAKLPPELAFVEDNPYAGTHHGQWTAINDGWENIRWQSMYSVLTAIESGHFKRNAYLEFYMAVEIPGDGTTPPPDVDITLWYKLPEDTTDQGNTHARRLTPRVDGQYHLKQIPLRHFYRKQEHGGTPVDLELLHLGLYQFSVGAQWRAGTKLKVDEVRIRW